MKERPILFSAPMILALLAGTKSQTRRIVKPQPKGFGAHWPNDAACLEWSDIAEDTDYHARCGHCPYGAAGDRLWVREAWGGWFQQGGVEADWKDTPRSWRTRELLTRVAYRATEPTVAKRWVTPLFMPRWASRMSLKITGIRVERVQAITDEDATAEGVLTIPAKTPGSTPAQRFGDLWTEINSAASWTANPFVWVVGFEREVAT